MAFTHLYVKSSYSLMNSTISIEKLVTRAKELQFDALALTDENVMYGVIPFYQACKNAGIKPIIGLAVKVMLDGEENECVLLAKNNQGYRALLKISTMMMLKDENYIMPEDLKSYTENLFGILPVANPNVQLRILTNTLEQLHQYIHPIENIFPDGHFYLGLDRNRERFVQVLKAMKETFGTKAAAVTEVKYLEEKDVYALDVLLAMKKGTPWDMKLSSQELTGKHLRNPLEMEQLFQQVWPEILAETEWIKEQCHVDIPFHQQLLPSFPVPDGTDAHSYLEKVCWEHVGKRYDRITDEVKERLTYELNVIKSMKFSDYFLIVADFIRFAKEQNILVGPGRGSSASSIVAYVLGITDVDPLDNELLFERFLNPERKSMPDIDVDFSDERRDEVIEYVRNKYGKDHVAQIITFGTFAARSLIRELMKTMDVDGNDRTLILKEIPQQTKQSIGEILKESKTLQELVKSSPKLKALFSIAAKLEGIPRHVSTHAAGVVISEAPLTDYVPLTAGGTGETYLTQFAMNELEAIGLLKMDFLGLRNLTLLEKIMKSIQYRSDADFTFQQIPENDEKTFALLRKGLTNGVFQLESEGMKQVLKELKPTNFEDIVAVNALYRPGPMNFIPVYIDRKHKRAKTTYPHPDLEPILKSTYGVLVYQEQIMQIAHRMAGFSLGEADILRRAVSKKNANLMKQLKASFVQGCIQNGYDVSIAEELFSWIVKFSNYGFPRSHAVAYSKISYQLSYLKAHYPEHFFAELLSSLRNQQEKLPAYIKEMKEMGINLLPPSINHSYGKFSVEGNNIRIGLSSIKGLGHNVVKEILEKRKDGPFRNLFDFCIRVNTDIVNRQSIENLILTGCFDQVYANRASLLATLDKAMDTGELFREFQDQPSLFQDKIDIEADYVPMDDFSLIKKLADEKELLGIYVSSHPLKEIRPLLRKNGYITLQQMGDLVGKRKVKSVGSIQAIRTIRTKRGDSMAFITLSDETDDADGVIFPELYRRVSPWLGEEMIVAIVGKIEQRNNKLQWVLDDISLFKEEHLHESEKTRLFIRVSSDEYEKTLTILKRIASYHPGSTDIYIYQQDKKQTYKLSYEFAVQPNYECIQELKQYFGEDNVVLQKAKQNES